MRSLHATALAFGALYALSALAPLSRSPRWWVRVWDTPRLQLLTLACVQLACLRRARGLGPVARGVAAGLTVVGACFDAFRVFPYSRLHPREVLPARGGGAGVPLRLFVANVLQDNRDAVRLLARVAAARPDVVLLVEVDDRWMRDLASLAADFPHVVAHPLPNTYGIALWSRLPLVDARVRFLVSDDVPSIEARVRLPSGDEVVLFGVHPRPPVPGEGDSAERDAELVLVGRRAAALDAPCVIMGDLNDVAWSHTTRLVRRVSRLLDPRVGRGRFNTFPVYAPFLRFPLDHFFPSDDFRIASLERLPSFGSDHFPMVAEFRLDRGAEAIQEAPAPRAGDAEDATAIVREAGLPDGAARAVPPHASAGGP